MNLELKSSQAKVLSDFFADVSKSLFVGAFLGQIVISENSGVFRFAITSIVLISSLLMLISAIKLTNE